MAQARKSVVPATPEAVAIPDVDTFTVESVREAGQSPDAAAAYASRALSAWIAGEESVGRIGSRMTVIAAYAAYADTLAGRLTDGAKPKDAADGVMDATEWGRQWVTPSNPDGVSRQAVITWQRAGEAFVEWGVSPESPEGKRLLGGLSQGREWNEARKVLRESLAELAESGDVPEPERVAEIATERIAEVRAEAEAAAAARKAEREAEAERKRAETRELLAGKAADDKSAIVAPDKGDVSGAVTAMQAILANLTVAQAHDALAQVSAWLDSPETATA